MQGKSLYVEREQRRWATLTLSASPVDDRNLKELFSPQLNRHHKEITLRRDIIRAGILTVFELHNNISAPFRANKRESFRAMLVINAVIALPDKVSYE